MVKPIDFTSWNVYDGASEGSGRSEKIWLQSKDGKIGLFKFPKINPSDNKVTTEHISEHLAHKIGNIIGIPTAKVDLGVYNGRIGCMSHFICEENEELREGICFISAKYPKYNVDSMFEPDEGKYYCLEHLLKSVPNVFLSRMWIGMILFDFLIGNSDRHHGNWAILIKKEEGSVRLKWSPLYDNGSSLCCYVTEEAAIEYLGNDKNRFESLVDSKSRTLIRIDGTIEKTPTHKELVQFLLNKFKITRVIARKIFSDLSSEKIEELLNEYPESLLSENKKDLIKHFLNRKREILYRLLKESEE